MSKLLIDNQVVLENLQAIIFDKDGTLIDIHYYWSSIITIRTSLVIKKWFDKTSAKEIELKLFDLMGIDVETGRIKPNGPVGIMPRSFIVEIVADFVRKEKPLVTNEQVENIFKEVDNSSSKNISAFLKILPGVKEFLMLLKQSKISSIIASTDITHRAILAMTALKLDKYFSLILGGDLVKKAKPNPDLAELAMSHLDCKSESIVVIGDHPVDIMMGEAVNAGLNIGVLTGLSNSSMFNDLECLIIDDFNSLSVSQ